MASFFENTIGGKPTTFLTEEGIEKFNTCAHRSEDMETSVIENCCSSRTVTGYTCTLLGIINVQATDCQSCQRYEKRESI